MIELRPRDATQLIGHYLGARIPVLLTGAPGVGKSSIVEQAASAAGFDIILSHPAVADPTDAKGLPWPGQDGRTATFLPFGDLAQALNAQKPTVWFLDDLGQASPAVQASYMQLLLARRVNGHKLP
jgi:MoxR-like ATPase